MRKTFTNFLLGLTILAAATVSGQTYFSDDFNDNDISDWTINDVDGDSQNWYVVDVGEDFASYFPTLCLGSRSWTDETGALTPDNYVTSPMIDLTGVTTGQNITLIFDSGSFQESPYFDEHYAVYVTTSNDLATLQAATPVFEETVPSQAVSQKIVNISSFAGQNVYLTFRHFDTTDENFLGVDNVKVVTLAENNVSVESAKLNHEYSLINQDDSVNVSLNNIGSNDISSVTIDWNDGTSHSSTIEVSIPLGESVVVQHPVPVNYSSLGEFNISVDVTQVNNSTDSDMTNNSASTTAKVISQDGGKKVLFEEGTGTWCGFCPGGAVMMDQMTENYPETFIGIAIHNNDPMAVSEYDSNAAFEGFPSMNVDRAVIGADVGIGDYPLSFLNSRLGPTPFSLNAQALVSGRELTINTSSTFYNNFNNANFKLGVIIVENQVTGTDSGYSQSNYFAGGGNGEMGGYENLPNPVPATDMVYNHVGRALLGGYGGQDNSIPTSLTDGQTVEYTFNYTVPEEYDLNHLHAVVVLINASNGQVVNANSFNLENLAVQDVGIKNSFSLYPNPAKENVNISISEHGNYKASIYNLTGQKVSTLDLNELNSDEKVTIPVNNLKPGIYILTLATKGKSFSKKLIIK